jgi:hypothetical protein
VFSETVTICRVFLAGFGDGLFDIGSPDMSIIAPVHVFSLSSMRGVGCDHNLSGAWEVLCHLPFTYGLGRYQRLSPCRKVIAPALTYTWGRVRPRTLILCGRLLLWSVGAYRCKRYSFFTLSMVDDLALRKFSLRGL